MIYEKRGTSVCISQFQIFKRVTKEEVYQYIRNAEKMEEDKYFIGILFTILSCKAFFIKISKYRNLQTLNSYLISILYI